MNDDSQRSAAVIEPADELRAALLMIREAVELLAPAGALPASSQFLNAMEEAEAIVQAICKIAAVKEVPE